MMFKNLNLYRVHDAEVVSLEDLSAALDNHHFKPVGAFEARCHGWIEPAGRNTSALVHDVCGRRLLCLCEQQRLLPSSVINEEVNERCEEVGRRQGLPVRRRERQLIKEQVIEELLPQAFARTTLTYVWWDTVSGLIGVDCSSEKRAETVIDALRQTLGSLKVTPLAVREPISRVMTKWVADNSSRPTGLVVRDKAVIRGNDDGVIRARAMDMDGKEIQAAIAAGRSVNSLSIDIESLMSFVLQDDFTLKSIIFDDSVIDESNDAYEEGDPNVIIQADLTVMSGAILTALELLMSWLGGEQPAATVGELS